MNYKCLICDAPTSMNTRSTCLILIIKDDICNYNCTGHQYLFSTHLVHHSCFCFRIMSTKCEW